MAKAKRRIVAAIIMSRIRRIGDFIFEANKIVLDIGNNAAIFVTPVPSLASVTTNITALQDAQTVALTRVDGSVAARNVAYNVVLNDMRDLLAYVQGLADDAGSDDDSIMIINASGFSVKINGQYQKPPLSAKNGPVSGTVLLRALGGPPRCSHEWQITNNSTPAAIWTSLPNTLRADTEVTGLARLSTQYFRHRLITKDGPQAWTQTVSLVVL